MTDLSRVAQGLPLEQQAIRANCFHPSGSFVEFRKDEIEQSIPSRFEQMVRRYPEHIAVKTKHHELTYAALNKMANRVARAILSCSLRTFPNRSDAATNAARRSHARMQVRT